MSWGTFPIGQLPNVQELEKLKEAGKLPPGWDLPITYYNPELLEPPEEESDIVEDEDGFYLGIWTRRQNK